MVSRANVCFTLNQLERVEQVRIRALLNLLPTLNHYEIGISSTWIVEHVRIGAELRLIYKIGKKQCIRKVVGKC